MKCKIEIECTPVEARQFFGFPDVGPMQATVMAEVERKMLAEMERFSSDAVLKSWFSMFPQTPEQFQEVFSKMMKVDLGGSGKP